MNAQKSVQNAVGGLALLRDSKGIDCDEENIQELSDNEISELEGIAEFYEVDDPDITKGPGISAGDNGTGEPGVDDLLDDFITAFDGVDFGPTLSAEGDMLGANDNTMDVSTSSDSSLLGAIKEVSDVRESFSNIVRIGNSAPPVSSIDGLAEIHGKNYFSESEFGRLRDRARDIYGSRANVVTYPTDAPSIMLVADFQNTETVDKPYVTIDLLLAEATLMGLNITLKSKTALRTPAGMEHFIGRTAQFIEFVLPKFPNYSELMDYGLRARDIAWDLVNVGDIYTVLKRKARSPLKPGEARQSNVDLSQQGEEKDNPVYMIEFHSQGYDGSPILTLNMGVRRVMDLQPDQVLGSEGLYSCVGLLRDQNGYPRVFNFYAPDCIDEIKGFQKAPDGLSFLYKGKSSHTPSPSSSPVPVIGDDGLRISVGSDGRYGFSTPAPGRMRKARRKRNI